MKPVHTRPFNLEHAKAGAPFCCADGREVTILKWDCRDTRYPLAGVCGSDDSSNEWGADGKDNPGLSDETLPNDLVMTPLGFIEGKPFFVGDEIVGTLGGKFIAGPSDQHGDINTWSWPLAYPETRMTDGELLALWNTTTPLQNGIQCLRVVVNGALRHAVDAGQLVIPGEAVPFLRPYNPYTGRRRDHRDIESDPMGTLIHHPGEPLRPAKDYTERDLTVAKAIRDVCMAAAHKGHKGAVEELLAIDLKSIVASIG